MSRMGPIVRGQGRSIMQTGCDEAERKLAQEAQRMVKARLNVVLKNPTGFYKSNIAAEPIGSRWQVHDNGVVYGPWLESGKNRRRTRFRGYLTFRKVALLFKRRAKERAEGVLFRYVRRLG
jgi:hypothetical protein